MTYTAPVDDLRFVLNEVVGLDAIAALPHCDSAAPDLVDAILEEAGKFASGVLAPLNRVGDKEGAKLENGVSILVPPHIESGTRVVVDTQTGEYVERAKD